MTIELLGIQPGYMPSERLEFEYRLQNLPASAINSVEASVVWYTEGKGSEDLGVHFFQRLTGIDIAAIDWNVARRLVTELPASPLSYEGRLLKIRWCIRVRVYLNDGREIKGEQPFYLGSITKEI